MKLQPVLLLCFLGLKSFTQPLCVAVDCKTTIQLPDSISLNGQVNSTYKVAKTFWNLVSGNNSVIISNNTGLNTPINNLISGTYIFSLTATDTQNNSAKAFDTLIVLPANKPPKAAIVVLPGNVITLPINTVTLSGFTSVDPDGSIAKYLWSTGDTTETISPIFGAAGTYNYSLIVTDNQNALDTAYITITVLPHINLPPVATVTGTPITSSSTDTLTVVATDPNPGGSIKQYGWGKLAGPGTQTILGSNTLQAIITGLQTGQYVFKVTCWGASGLTTGVTYSFTVNLSKTITKVVITYYYSDGTILTTTQP